jgi:dTDP-4-dehydrorhamnose 3,5-epimerase
MKFHPTPLGGAFLIELEPRRDERGFLARSFCAEEFAEAGLQSEFVQANNSYSEHAGTLRGMHYQLPPSAESKLVRTIHGAIYDQILDLRPDSPTFGQSFGAELTMENRLMMYVPRGFAHGLLSLRPQTEVLYMVSAAYAPQQERGLRHDDPRFGLEWPEPPRQVSPKDASWPDFDADIHGVEQLRGL